MKVKERVAGVFGYDLIRRAKHPTSRSHLQNLLQRHGVETVVDVGANHGQFGALLRELGFRGAIHSFEPVSKTFALLRQRADADPLWAVHQLALGAASGEGVVNVAASSDLSSMLTANDFGRTRFEQIAPTGTEIVRIETLDGFVATHRELQSQRLLIKMDTQGFDLQVFEGGPETFARAQCLMSELSLIPIYDGAPHWLDVLARYEARGFRVSGLYPVSRARDLSVVEFDCLMVNAQLAGKPPC